MHYSRLHWPYHTYAQSLRKGNKHLAHVPLGIWHAINQHTHTRLTALFSGTTRVSRYQRGKTNLDFYWSKETVSDSGISWAICNSAPRSRQITMPAPHHSVFYRPDALPAAQPTASKHWRQAINQHCVKILMGPSSTRELYNNVKKHTMLYTDWVQPTETPFWSILISVKIWIYIISYYITSSDVKTVF